VLVSADLVLAPALACGAGALASVVKEGRKR
jgi:hypothetical protein